MLISTWCIDTYVVSCPTCTKNHEWYLILYIYYLNEQGTCVLFWLRVKEFFNDNDTLVGVMFKWNVYLSGWITYKIRIWNVKKDALEIQYRFTKFTFYACLQKERVQKNLAHSTMGQWKLTYKKTQIKYQI